MADAQPSDAPPPGADAKIREEWRKLERQRIDEEIAEAREDVTDATRARLGPPWLMWTVFAVALAAGIAAAVYLNWPQTPAP